MGFRGNQSSRVACADLSDAQQAEKLNATTSPPRAREASRARAAAAAGCYRPDAFGCRCCSSAAVPVPSACGGRASSGACCVEHGTGTALPQHSAASAGLCSCMKDPALQTHPAQPSLGCASHRRENICSLGLRSLGRGLARQRCAIVPFPGVQGPCCGFGGASSRGAPNHEGDRGTAAALENSVLKLFPGKRCPLLLM